jgi:pSer/pThr/pTyr-binding forkhead associated (FHA) protein
MKRRPKSGNVDEQSTLGELIVQTGRHAGARRPLAGPVVLIGRAPGCDVRLQMEGVEPRHCLLAHTPEGVFLRDLQTDVGTLVNGTRVQGTLLRDGDVVAVGSVQFRVHGLPQTQREERLSPAEAAALRDAWRVQTAAVAAQQIALEEEAVRLEQRQHAFARQEEQVAAHLEEKNRRLVGLTEEARAERDALDRDRAAYESYVASIKGDLTEAQRELMEGQRQAEKERARLADLRQRLKARWHRFWLAERKKHRAKQAELSEAIKRFGLNVEAHQEEEEALAAKRLRFNTLYELGRGALREAWSRLRQEQHRWKHRRGKERAALKIRARDLEIAERQLVHAQNLFLMDQKAWDARKQALDVELRGIDRRIDNQRLRIRTCARWKSACVNRHPRRPRMPLWLRAIRRRMRRSRTQTPTRRRRRRQRPQSLSRAPPRWTGRRTCTRCGSWRPASRTSAWN